MTLAHFQESVNWKVHFLTSSYPVEFKLWMIVTDMDMMMNVVLYIYKEKFCSSHFLPGMLRFLMQMLFQWGVKSCMVVSAI